MRLVACTPQTNEVLNRFFDDDYFFSSGNFYPALDVVEETNQYVLKLDLPGINKEDIKVSVENGVLTIEGERKSENEEKDKQFHRVERRYGRFVRTLNLGTGVDNSKIHAAYKDGVLQLSVPKLEAAQPKSIDIQVE